MKKLLLLVLCCILALFTLVGCDESDTTDSTVGVTENATEPTEAAEEPASAAISFGDTFTFDDLDITFLNDVTWSSVDNQFSDHDGDAVFLVPLTITNNSDETTGLNMFSYSQYGPDGTQIDSVSAYFMDEDVDFAGDMRPGATQESKMAFLYVGDGDYVIEFGIFGTSVEVILPITK